MRTIIFTNARDEKNILEWTIHHLNLGFTHIYIRDHLSTDPLHGKFDGLPVTVERINRKFFDKRNTMIESINFATKNGFNWLIYMDCDEFLILNQDSNIESFINKYETYDQVGINWVMFGSNYHNNDPPGTILENYTKSDNVLNAHVKSFLKLPTKLKYIWNPHSYILEDMSKSIGTDYKPLDKINPWFSHNNSGVGDVSAYIAHFIFQSYATYIQRKVKLPADDTGSYRKAMTQEELHNLFNNYSIFGPKEKYNENNIKKMKEFKFFKESKESNSQIKTCDIQNNDKNKNNNNEDCGIKTCNVQSLKNKSTKPFDWITYVENYEDLIKANIDTAEKAYTHWISFGIKEGRTYTKIEKKIK